MAGAPCNSDFLQQSLASPELILFEHLLHFAGG